MMGCHPPLEDTIANILSAHHELHRGGYQRWFHVRPLLPKPVDLCEVTISVFSNL